MSSHKNNSAPYHNSLVGVVVFLLLLLLQAPAVVAADGVALPAVKDLPCPLGWTSYTTPDSTNSSNTLYQCIRAVTLAEMLAPPQQAAELCQKYFSYDYPQNNSLAANPAYQLDYTRGTAPRTVAVHSAAANAFLQTYYYDTVNGDATDRTLITLGGVAEYGKVWWLEEQDEESEGGAAAAYQNFATTDTTWQVSIGCIAMERGGTWRVVDCYRTARPYFCSFPLTAAVIVPTAVEEDNTTTSTTTTTTEAPVPGATWNLVTRPSLVNSSELPQPCQQGWTPAPATVTGTSYTGVYCYKVFATPDETGGYGRTFTEAEAHCESYHPKATLASVLSPEEQKWVVQELVGSDATLQRLMALSPLLHSNVSDADDYYTYLPQTPVVYLGGRFTQYGALGMWIEDDILFNTNETNYNNNGMLSSYAWPTAANKRYQHWGEGQPVFSYGCVGLSIWENSSWVATDCRATQPYLCSYYNDGSTFATTTTTTTTRSPTDNTTDVTGDCVEGWSYFGARNRCYRLYVADSNTSSATAAVAASELESTCQAVLSGTHNSAQQLLQNPSAVHAASVLSYSESSFVGALVQRYNTALAAAPNQTNATAITRALVGVLYSSSGSSGYYLDGSAVLVPGLASMLWAAGQPSSSKGCVAVDASGQWYYYPCYDTTSTAYVCAYTAGSLTYGSDGTGTTTSTTTRPPVSPNNTISLEGRVAALSGANHLVVSAGTVGVYTVESNGGAVDGLLLHFAPVSPYYYSHYVDAHPPATYTNGGTTNQSHYTAYMQSINARYTLQPSSYASWLFEASSPPAGGAGPCGAYKKQKDIHAVFDGRVTVDHPLEPTVGFVCVSENGRDYVATNITYEVVGAALRGFIPFPNQNNNADDSSSTSGQLPSFYTAAQLAEASHQTVVQTEMAMERFSSGTVQLVMRNYDAAAPSSGDSSTSALYSLRLSESADCTNTFFTLLATDIPIIDVRGRVYNHTMQTEAFHAFAYYQADDSMVLGDMANTSTRSSAYYRAFNVNKTWERMSDENEEAPREYYVCVAAKKTTPAALPWLYYANLSYWTSSSSSTSTGTSTAADYFAELTRQRLYDATTSVDLAGNSVLLYTAVPHLKVYLTEPAVQLRGLWVLPPRMAFPEQRVYMQYVPRLGRTRDAYLLAFNSTTTATANSTSHVAVASATSVYVTQYSSPVIVFDGPGLQAGMSVLLTSDASSCSREQQAGTNRTDGLPSGALDTMLTVSVLTIPLQNTSTLNASSSFYDGTHTLAYVQLNTNHTGLYGLPPSSSQSLYLCFAYNVQSPYTLLRPTLKIVVQPLVVERATAVPMGSDPAASVGWHGNSTDLNVNVGYAGMLRLWGIDTRLWSEATINAAEIAFTHVLPSDTTADRTATQCQNSALFYKQVGLGILPHLEKVELEGYETQSWLQRLMVQTTVGNFTSLTSTSTSTTTDNATSVAPHASIIIPTDFLTEESGQSMRVCLSVPRGFDNVKERVFLPTAATINVHALQILSVGRYRVPTTTDEGASSTVIRVAEDAVDVIFPVVGYGLRDDMHFFLAEQSCQGLAWNTTAASDPLLVQRQSIVNLTLTSLYDLPYRYQDHDSDAATAAATDGTSSTTTSVFLLLTQQNITGWKVADTIFTTSRVPRHVCLYAPGTQTLVYSTGFQLVVQAPYITAITNVARDESTICDALESRGVPCDLNGGSDPSASTMAYNNSEAEVVYATYTDLLVEGFGIEEGKTEIIPAVDCSNASSFLWLYPLTLSPIPSLFGYRFAASSRYNDPQMSMRSAYIPVHQGQSTRFGAEELQNGLLERFTWCVRFWDPEDDSVTGFASTGIPYHYVIPNITGFETQTSGLVEDVVGAITQTLVLPIQDKALGEWQRIQLVGPLIDITHAAGSPLYMFLVEISLPCQDVKNYYVRENLVEEHMIVAVNGSAIVLPSLLTTVGRYKLCVSAVYPSNASTVLGTESALQMFALENLTVELIDPTYAVFTLNGTTLVQVEQGQEWTLQVRGSWLSNHSLVRFRPVGADCATAMPNGLLDVPIRDMFEGFSLFGRTVGGADTTVSADGTTKDEDAYYIVLEQAFLRALAAPQRYQMCLKATRASAWTETPVNLVVVQHVRKPTHYNYFAADGREDVAAMYAITPTKVALGHMTGRADEANIVGTVGREVTVALWCLNGSDSDNFVPCGDNRRVMFVKPLDNDADPCFVDAEAVTDDIQRGPFVLDFGVLTLPHNLSTNMYRNAYPHFELPWIMCLETGAEQWREPIYPMTLLQYSTALPVGFRTTPDDASNTTATFPGGVTPPASAAGDDRAEAEGNTTLVLFANDSSHVFYLNGYGIEKDQWLRFGAKCEEEVVVPTGENENSTDDNATVLAARRAAAVRAQQGLNNSLFYDAPLRIEDDSGVFLVPYTYVDQLQDATHVCLSTDNGTTYTRTSSLYMQVTTSRLRTDQPEEEDNILTQVLRDTLLLPLGGRGSVDLAALQQQQEKLNTTAASRLVPGAVVVLSASCTEDTAQLPALTVGEDNTIALTEVHTASPTVLRLRMCVRPPGGATSSSSDNSVNNANAEAEAEASSSSPSGTAAPTTAPALEGYYDGGVYVFVLNVTIERVAEHQWESNAAVKAAGIDQLLLRRDKEDLLLPLRLRSSGTSYADAEDNGSDDESSFYNSVYWKGLSGTDKSKNMMLQLLNDESVLPFLELVQVRVGKPCSQPLLPLENSNETVNATSSAMMPYAVLRAAFAAESIRVTEEGTSAETNDFAAYLPIDRTVAAAAFHPWDPASLCLSLDGGLHFYAIGAAYFTTSFAPTLRLRVLEDNDNDVESTTITTAAAQAEVVQAYKAEVDLYEYMGVSAAFTDTRYDARFYRNDTLLSAAVAAAELDDEAVALLQALPPTAFPDTAANQYLNGLTMDALWSGFVAGVGLASEGYIHLPALSHADIAELRRQAAALQNNTEDGAAANETLDVWFFATYEWPREPTGLTIRIRDTALTCVGSGSLTTPDIYIRRVDGGTRVVVGSACSGGLQEGMRLRLVALPDGDSADLADLCTAPRVISDHVLEIPVTAPANWAAAVTATANATTRVLPMPPGVGYLRDGRYGVCLKHSLFFAEQVETNYTSTPLVVHVSSELAVRQVARVFEGAVAVFQGASAVLPVEGSALGRRGVSVLFGFSAAATWHLQLDQSSNATIAVHFNGSCADVAQQTDVYTKQNLAQQGDVIAVTAYGTDTTSSSSSNWLNESAVASLLGLAWAEGGSTGTLTIPASALRYVTPAATSGAAAAQAVTMCYSVDGGLSFAPVGGSHAEATVVAAEEGDSAAAAAVEAGAVRLVVVPPTITSLQPVMSTRGSRSVSATNNNHTVQEGTVVANTAAERVQRVANISAPTATATVRYTYVNASNTANATYTATTTDIRSRLPSYLYPAGAEGFVGNGFGAGSRRDPLALLLAEDDTSAAEALPTVAATVAILRTSLFGATCTGAEDLRRATASAGDSAAMTADTVNYTNALALPLFVLNLRDGTLWNRSSTAKDTVEGWYNRVVQSAVWAAELQARNPALQRNASLNTTDTLLGLLQELQHTSSAPITFYTLLNQLTATAATGSSTLSTLANLVMGESLLVCLSLDGTHYFSADYQPSLQSASSSDIAAALRTVEHNRSVVAANVTAAAPTALSALSSASLFLRPQLAAVTNNNNSTDDVVVDLDEYNYYMRDVSMLVEVIVRVNRTALVADGGGNTNTTASDYDFWLERAALEVSADALARLQRGLAAAVNTTPSVVQLQLQPLGPITTPTTAEDAANATEAGADTVSLQSYALVVSIAADAALMNSTTGLTARVAAAPEILYRLAELLRSNTSQYTLLSTLLPTSSGASSEEAGAQNYTRYLTVSAVAMEFYFSSGVELHTALNATTNVNFSLSLPVVPAAEATWRSLFLAIPKATLTPATVPDDPDNETASKVTWWVVPLLMILPILIVAGSYFVYIKYLKVEEKKAEDVTVTSVPAAGAPPQQGQPAPTTPGAAVHHGVGRATEVTIENAQP